MRNGPKVRLCRPLIAQLIWVSCNLGVHAEGEEVVVWMEAVVSVYLREGELR